MKWLLVAVCLIQVAQIAIAGQVPVFVWGDSKLSSAPVFNPDATDNLESIVAQKAAKVIFVESQLSSDDFTYCQVERGQDCLSYLSKQAVKFYSPDVDSPYDYLRSRIYEDVVESVDADQEFSVTPGKTVFVHFKDVQQSSTQAQRLAAHDKQIEAIVSRLGSTDIVYIYTGSENEKTLKRATRQTTPTPEPNPFTDALFEQDKYYILYLRNMSTIKDDVVNNITVAGATVTMNLVNQTMTLNISTDPMLSLEILIADGRWGVEKVMLDGFPNPFVSGGWIGANNRSSYSCSPMTNFISHNETTILQLGGLQLQVDLYNANDTLVFGDANNCVGFLSGGIVGGLFVTFLLLIILSIGLTWMMDIKTMDRFDDPKGKTIIINAQE